MNTDSFVESTETLKKTVPLMMKHKVPITPTNYALWYTYTKQQTPELNLAIDHGIAELGLCTPTLCESLYQKHLANQTEQDVRQVKQSLTAMVQELSHTMMDALSDTEIFQGVLTKSFDQLETAEQNGLSLDDTMKLVRDLIRESRQIQASTGTFKGQLSSAKDEITTLREALAESQKEANEDALTGILNRRAFDRDFQHYIESNTPLSFILLDIDKFKDFNDKFGHLMGDQVLKTIARRLKENCRDYAQAYRFGGEEFAIILPHKMKASARQQAETFRRAFERISVIDKKTGLRVNSITASFGVAEKQPNESGECLIDRADTFMNQAKQLGRNRVLPLN